jgi:hypothetical protein
MKNLKLILSIAILSMVSLGASSQCPGTVKVTNQSGDDWNIRMYDGSIQPVLAGSSIIYSYPNGDPLASVGAFTSAICDFPFLATSGIINVTSSCTSSPTRIYYKKSPATGVCGVISMGVTIYN